MARRARQVLDVRCDSGTRERSQTASTAFSKSLRLIDRYSLAPK
jgi:hypothetical protein